MAHDSDKEQRLFPERVETIRRALKEGIDVHEWMIDAVCDAAAAALSHGAATNTANPERRSSPGLSELKPDGNKERSGEVDREGRRSADITRSDAVGAGGAECSSRAPGREGDRQGVTGEGVSAPSHGAAIQPRDEDERVIRSDAAHATAAFCARVRMNWEEKNLQGIVFDLLNRAFNWRAAYPDRDTAPLSATLTPVWIVNDNGELGVKVGERFFFLYKGDNLEYETGKHDDGTQMMYRIVGKREFGETCQPLQHLREKWPGGQGAHYMEPLVFTPGLSFGKPGDGDWKPLPTSMAATDGSAKGVG